MDTTEARTRGMDAGRSAALHCEIYHRLNREPHVRRVDVLTEIIAEEAFEAEMHARQYAGSTPLEFAQMLNRGISEERFEELWDAYEDGVAIAIERVARERAESILQHNSVTP